jgi:hypothetical protein
LRSFIAGLPNVQPNGKGFVLAAADRLWMEIDLEHVSEEGDTLDTGEALDSVNCVNLHIPYPFLGRSPERDYFPTAISIAEHLDWTAMDRQTDQPNSAAPARSWWKFW